MDSVDNLSVTDSVFRTLKFEIGFTSLGAKGINDFSKKDISQNIPQKEKFTKGWVVPTKKVIVSTISQSLPPRDVNPISNFKVQNSESVTDKLSTESMKIKIKSYSIYDMNSKGNCNDSDRDRDSESNKNVTIKNDLSQMIPQRIISIVKPLHLPRNNVNNNNNNNNSSSSNSNNNSKNNSSSQLRSIVVETAKTLLEKSANFQVTQIVCYLELFLV